MHHHQTRALEARADGGALPERFQAHASTSSVVIWLELLVEFIGRTAALVSLPIGDSRCLLAWKFLRSRRAKPFNFVADKSGTRRIFFEPNAVDPIAETFALRAFGFETNEQRAQFIAEILRSFTFSFQSLIQSRAQPSLPPR